MSAMLEFWDDGKFYQIRILQVRRARGHGRNCYLSVFNVGTIHCPFSLKKIFELTKAFNFVDAQRCYVLNPEAVVRLFHHQHHYAVLDNGEEVYVTEEAYKILQKYRAAKLNNSRPPSSEGGFFPLFPN